MARFKKGQSGNPDGRSRVKKPGEILELGIFNLAIPETPTEKTLSTFFSSYIINTKDWIDFGSDNLFPQAIAALNRQSPVHRGILNNKAIYTKGKGFSFDEKNIKLKTFIEKSDGKNNNLIKTIGNCIVDKYHSGNAYLEIVKGIGFINVFHRDYTTARVHKEGKHILFYSDWAHVSQAKGGEIKKIPIYPEFEKVDGNLRSVIHFKCYEPEFQHYGLPDWIAAMDAAGICYKTNKWNLSRLDNSFVGSGVLLVEGNFNGAKERKDLKTKILKEFTGEGKQGKLMVAVKQLGEGGKAAQSIFTPFNDVKDADWLSLHKQSIQDLIISHNWFRSLSGLAEAGQMGNTQQIRNEYQIAINTVVSAEQEIYLGEIKNLLKNELKIDSSSLAFINKPPVSIVDLLDPKTILTEDEQRGLLGYAPKTEIKPA